MTELEKILYEIKNESVDKYHADIKSVSTLFNLESIEWYISKLWILRMGWWAGSVDEWDANDACIDRGRCYHHQGFNDEEVINYKLCLSQIEFLILNRYAESLLSSSSYVRKYAELLKEDYEKSIEK